MRAYFIDRIVNVCIFIGDILILEVNFKKDPIYLLP